MPDAVAFDLDVCLRLFQMAAADPAAAPGAEEIAAVRLYFYADRVIMLPSVAEELAADEASSGPEALVLEQVDVDEFYHGCVKGRADAYLDIHSDPRDCRVVAEAECAHVGALATLKSELIDRLAGHVERIELRTPLELWSRWRVPHGAHPKRSFSASHPLTRATWWVW